MPGYVIKVTIEDTHPPVWRRIVIPDRISFKSLHRILQTAFQWEDYHMHDFSFPNVPDHIVMEGEADEDNSSEERVLVDEFLLFFRFIRYTYDFGDNWRHKIAFEKEDPDYRNRYASVIKYKGDSFEEDSGGVWGSGEEERVAFDLERINGILKDMDFPVQKADRADKTLLEDISVGKDYRKLLQSLNEIGEKLSMIAEEIRKRDEDNEESELSKRVRQWRALCETSEAPGKNNILKNISSKSSTELLSQLNAKEARDYCKYIGVSYEEADCIAESADAFWKELEDHPWYLTYVFSWRELEMLIAFMEQPNGICQKVPDMDMMSKAMSLGFLDMSEEQVNRKPYIVLRQTREAAALLGQYTRAEWEDFSKKSEERIKKCDLLLNLYNFMDLDIFYEKYREYYEPDAVREEVYRSIYLGGTFCRRLSTGECGTYGNQFTFVAQSETDTLRVADRQIKAGDKIDYRPFSARERRNMLRGYAGLYPVWKEFGEYLLKSFDVDEFQLEEDLLEYFYSVKNGEGMEALWEMASEDYILESVEDYVCFWHYLFGAILTTGLPEYKGYSRKEYAKLTGTPTAELGIYEDFKPDGKITKASHLSELPVEFQLQVYEADEERDDRKRREKLEHLVKELECENYELMYLFSSSLIYTGEYENAQRLLRKIRKEYPGDKGIEYMLKIVRSAMQRQAADEEMSVWDMVDGGKMPKSNAMTYRREQPKIGRNDPCPCGSGKKYKKCCGKP